MDGKSILGYFNNRIAAEIRLPEAIDRKLLCPFQYFGVTDTVDLDQLKWSAGGYDKAELSKIYTLSGMIAERRADLVVSSLLKYVTDALFFWKQCPKVSRNVFVFQIPNRRGSAPKAKEVL